MDLQVEVLLIEKCACDVQESGMYFSLEIVILVAYKPVRRCQNHWNRII